MGSVLTWNLYQRPRLIATFLDIHSLPRRRERLRGILKVIEESDYDLLCMQEAFTRPIRSALVRRFPYAYAKLAHRWCICTHSGLMILSRHPITSREGHVYNGPLGRGRTADAWVDKGIMHAEVQLPDGPLHVFNTHLQADGQYADVRAVQLEQAYDFIRRFSGRALLAGDFNLEVKEEEILQEVQRLGFQDAWIRTHPEDPGITRPEGGQRYDRIFMRDLDVRGAGILSTRWSDHHGVSASFVAD